MSKTTSKKSTASNQTVTDSRGVIVNVSRAPRRKRTMGKPQTTSELMAASLSVNGAGLPLTKEAKAEKAAPKALVIKAPKEAPLAKVRKQLMSVRSRLLRLSNRVAAWSSNEGATLLTALEAQIDEARAGVVTSTKFVDELIADHVVYAKRAKAEKQPVVAGGCASMREKARAKYEGLIASDDLATLRVVSIGNKGTAIVETLNGLRMIVRLSSLVYKA